MIYKAELRRLAAKALNPERDKDADLNRQLRMMAMADFKGKICPATVIALLDGIERKDKALRNLLSLAIPGMNWTDEIWQLAIREARVALGVKSHEKQG